MSKQKPQILLYGDGLTKADLAKFGAGVGAREARYFDGVEQCDGVIVQTMHGTFIERITAAYKAAGIPILAGAEDMQSIKPRPAHVAEALANPAALIAGGEWTDVTIGDAVVPLVKIVAEAFEDSGAPSVAAWNNAEQSVRDQHIKAVVGRLTAESGGIGHGPASDAPEPPAPTLPKPRRTYTRRAVKAATSEA